MSNALEKIADKIPYAEGGLRRRFTSGGLIVVPLLMFIVALSPVSFKDIDIPLTDLLTSPVVALALLVFIYAVGNAVDMVGEVFIVSWTGRIILAAEKVNKEFRERLARMLWLYRFLLFPLLGALIYAWPIAVAVKASRTRVYRWDVTKALRGRAEDYFQSLPDIVKEGLAEPVGEYFEIAWKFLQLDSSEEQKAWLIRLDSRNKDILSITSSLTILSLLSFAAFQVYFVLLVENPSQVGMEGSGILILGVVLPLLFFIIVVLFIGYFKILKRSIVTALQIQSSLLEKGASDSQPPTQQPTIR